MRRPETGTEVAVCGEFLEVRPPERLRYTWRWDGAFAGMPESVVTVEFAQSEGGTELSLRHDGFAEAAARQRHRTGWIVACNRLDRSLFAPRAVSETPPRLRA